jgi:DNA-binding NarL/FixJ family response regulator
MKRESTGKILDAIREVLAGRLFADRDVFSRLTARALGKAPAATSPADLLSDRELEVFRRLGAGLSTREIAAELGLGFKSVQTYCRRIKEKLGLEDARELARKAFEHSSRPDQGPLYGG